MQRIKIVDLIVCVCVRYYILFDGEWTSNYSTMFAGKQKLLITTLDQTISQHCSSSLFKPYTVDIIHKMETTPV